MKRSLALPALAAAFFAAPASAQPPAKQGAAADPSEVVVTGRRNLDRDIRAFVGALAKPSHGDQIATYKEEICPVVHGLRPASAEIVIHRMRRVAAASGLRVAPERCSAPNILVIVVPDKKKALEALRRGSPGVFGEMARDDIDALIRSDSPAAAWNIVEARGTAGEDIGNHDGSPATVSWATPWRLASNTRIQLEGAVVLLEASALQGRTLMQIADYAAMRSFADIKPAAIAALPAPSILALFDKGPAAAPQSVTQWDFSYLKALYATRSDVPGNLQQGAIAHVFKKDLERTATGSKQP